MSKERIIEMATALGCLLLLAGSCSQDSKEPTEIYRGSYIQQSNIGRPTDDYFYEEKINIPHTTDTLSMTTSESRSDMGFLKYEMEYEIKGHIGELRISIERKEKIYEQISYNIRIIYEKGQYGELSPEFGGGYAYEVREDGIYTGSGNLAIELDNYGRETWTTSFIEKGEEEVRETFIGRTGEPYNSKTEISDGERKYQLERETDGIIRIEETKPKTIGLGYLTKD